MKYGKSLDVGTHTLVSAMETEEGIEYTKQIDSFFTMEASEESESLLGMLNIPYVLKKGKISVVGEESIRFANMFKSETRRPLQGGCLNKEDLDALGMLQVLIKEILGAPRKESETLKYSVTSTPLGTNQNFEYHKQQLESIFKGLGYSPEPIQEARAVALAELATDKFTGLCCSFGHGTTTVWLGHYGIDNPRLQFSVGIGGSWIDENAAEMFAGLTKTKVQSIKEKGFDITAPNKGVDVDSLEGQDLLQARAREAISAYYKACIRNVFKAIKTKFDEETLPEFDKPIKMVIAGGTSMAPGFIDLCKQELAQMSFPVDISEIVHASDPLHSVARGCLVAAHAAERKK